MTEAEYQAIQAMARTSGNTVADETRLALLEWAALSGTELPIEI